jgi:hypothetical protein
MLIRRIRSRVCLERSFWREDILLDIIIACLFSPSGKVKDASAVGLARPPNSRAGGL